MSIGTGRAGDRSRTGVLYLVAVPIGHPDDLTLRARRILGEVDVIASEQPETTRQLLAHHSISTAVTSYGPSHLKEKIAVLMARLHEGARIALVSDCGTPVLADPGCLLVTAAHSGGIPVVSLPGPSALTAAVAASGLPGDSFFFQRRLPERNSDRRRCLADCLGRRCPSVIFCTPSLIAEALSIITRLAPRRRIALACDLTKPGELIIRGTARQTLERMADLLSAEDITLIVAGRPPGGGQKRMK
jgi:16S rRNA (cytidine1402-2'-O)-methyltransferase